MASAASTNAPRCRPAELARQLGVSRQAVHDLIRRNVIELGTDGLVDLELARHAIASRVHPRGKTSATLSEAPAGAPPAASALGAAAEHADSATTSYHVAKTLREAAEARIAQLRLAELRGELIRVDDVRSVYSRRIAALRESIMQIPPRLAAVLAAETDLGKVHDALQLELRQVLEQVTADPAA